MKKTALIMAGGSGERFWPKSRKALPKQFLILTNGEKSMIQLTVERILSLISAEDIFIVTNEAYKALVLEQLPQIPDQNVLCEPNRRNTAACIGLGAVHIAKRYEDSIMVILPADHFIEDTCLFTETIKKACEIAEINQNLVTLGIKPDHPETGYGYIRFNSKHKLLHSYSVDCFVEKPKLEKAKEFLAADNYLWNSGIFVWKTSSVLNKFQLYLPELFEKLIRIQKAIGSECEFSVLKEEYLNMESTSIDYGIMEKSKDIFTIPCTFKWDDVGSWLAVERFHECDANNNTISGNAITISTKNCIVEGQDKVIVTIGLDNLLVVDTDDVIMICKKDKTHEIPEAIKKLSDGRMDKYL